MKERSKILTETKIKGSSGLPSSDVDQNEGATASTKNVLLERFQDAYSTQEEDVSKFVTFYTKDHSRDAGHMTSRKYYFPNSPNCTVLAQRSGLLTDLIKKAYVSPCGSTYQLGFQIPMLKHDSCFVYDLSAMRIRNWDNSILLVNRSSTRH